VSEAAAGFLARHFELARVPAPGPGGAVVHALCGHEPGAPTSAYRNAFVGRREELERSRSRLGGALEQGAPVYVQQARARELGLPDPKELP